ncbi:MAG: hypothetical protein IVW55_16395 [Chloroflexi bacterium]|nr:hypothetical protein [Chloroflexota bacterium]
MLIAFSALSYAQSNSITVTMNAQNGSGQSGMATLTDMGNGQTTVSVNISGGIPDGQPAHIHKGTCATLDPSPLYPLTSIVNGTSEATINASLSDLTSGTYAINVHKSKTEASVYVSCGDILATTAGTGTVSPGMPGTGNNDQTFIIALALLALAATGSGLKLARRKA